MAQPRLDWQLDDVIEHRDTKPGADSYMGVGVERATGIIRSVGRGFWSAEQVDRYFADFRRLAARVRRDYGTIRMLVDLREVPTQAPQVATRVQHGADGLYLPEDRIAMVVANSLVKMQMRRVLDPQVHSFFISIDAAETWLRAWR